METMKRLGSVVLGVLLCVALVIPMAGLAYASADATVVVSPATQNVAPGATFSVDILVDPSSYGVSGGEVDVAFNPSAMSAADIVFGDLFGASPLVGSKKIDNTLGTIQYALARDGTTTVPTAAGKFATITFTAGSTAGNYAIDITFIGLADDSFNDITGVAITDGSVTVWQPGPTDATLSNLTISAGTLTPAFASGNTGYTDGVANSVNSVTVTPTANESHATITVNGVAVASGSASGAIALNVGDNTITIVVTAQDGTTSDTYTVTVTRAATPTSTPTVTTSAAMPVASSSATLNGDLAALGTAGSVSVSFEWGTTTSYGSETTSQSISAIGTFDAKLTGLSANTTYHFRAKAVGDGAAVYGDDMTFTTTAPSGGGMPTRAWVYIGIVAIAVVGGAVFFISRRPAKK
ncbi:MAG: cadherin-like beta sandwich domain-containing protein [Chloroflexi bacterium]|nr:cadherin-like beta sandwich domain-containing protein [Chloroflexota bacterium]